MRFLHQTLWKSHKQISNGKNRVCHFQATTNHKRSPQGSVLSPLLFNIFINDLLERHYNGMILAFADDIKIIGPRGPLLQSDINIIQEWANINSMIINKRKSETIHFATLVKLILKQARSQDFCQGREVNGHQGQSQNFGSGGNIRQNFQ